MKAALILMVIAALTACGKRPEPSPDQEAVSTGLTVYHDRGTGCEYLRAGSGALTPRLGPDGKQVCK